MGKYKDIKNQKFGKLTPIEHVSERNGEKYSGWKCVCDCGNFTYQSTNSLTSGRVKSCGCYARERTHKIHIAETHGESKTRLFITWRNMRVRCNYPKDKRFEHYGGRGIKVCEEWEKSFEAFRDWALAHGYSDELTIDRINVDGDYEPDNCRFITRAENNRNRRKFKKQGGLYNG